MSINVILLSRCLNTKGPHLFRHHFLPRFSTDKNSFCCIFLYCISCNMNLSFLYLRSIPRRWLKFVFINTPGQKSEFFIPTVRCMNDFSKIEILMYVFSWELYQNTLYWCLTSVVWLRCSSHGVGHKYLFFLDGKLSIYNIIYII